MGAFKKINRDFIFLFFICSLCRLSFFRLILSMTWSIAMSRRDICIMEIPRKASADMRGKKFWTLSIFILFLCVLLMLLHCIRVEVQIFFSKDFQPSKNFHIFWMILSSFGRPWLHSCLYDANTVYISYMVKRKNTSELYENILHLWI